MKNILMTLVITAMAFTSVQAQEKCVCKKTVKHTAAKHRTSSIPASAATVSATEAEACRLVPKEVCKISADRRSVTCYKTIDLETLAPYGNEVKHYGSTGPVPGSAKMKFGVPTLVINEEDPNMNKCVRDSATGKVVCYIQRPGIHITRDKNGYYSYSDAPATSKTNNRKTTYVTPRVAAGR
ncbi:hypothetical protein CJD36_018555 [Flavipsychrobacter stenotrophus]|uniref:Uncharacterized protein n=1 Tax=Flavipsychrobacter stenotrophus TaxID=2077091 RepID=A0A2S7SRJ1_9BACT|nr:hypothetical protein [Flavipsychrobacter stenotrophus]PQJ09251.1 hypothetical protein CJD36_018555 [Flavipsychrobacter stenotrophus]